MGSAVGPLADAMWTLRGIGGAVRFNVRAGRSRLRTVMVPADGPGLHRLHAVQSAKGPTARGRPESQSIVRQFQLSVLGFLYCCIL